MKQLDADDIKEISRETVPEDYVSKKNRFTGAGGSLAGDIN